MPWAAEHKSTCAVSAPAVFRQCQRRHPRRTHPQRLSVLLCRRRTRGVVRAATRHLAHSTAIPRPHRATCSCRTYARSCGRRTQPTTLPGSRRAERLRVIRAQLRVRRMISMLLPAGSPEPLRDSDRASASGPSGLGCGDGPAPDSEARSALLAEMPSSRRDSGFSPLRGRATAVRPARQAGGSRRGP